MMIMIRRYLILLKLLNDSTIKMIVINLVRIEKRLKEKEIIILISFKNLMMISLSIKSHKTQNIKT
jgi:hypothetical protein